MRTLAIHPLLAGALRWIVLAVAVLVLSLPAFAAFFNDRAVVAPTPPVEQTYFGISVSQQGNRLAVMSVNPGRTRIYERGTTGWTLQATLETQYPFMYTPHVTIDGDSLLATHQVWVKNGSGWSVQFTAPVSNNWEVGTALSGNTLVMGTPEAGGTDGGAIVYVRSGTTWTQQAVLSVAPAGVHENAGVRVAISGDTIAVGGNPVGSTAPVYVYTRTGTTWTQQARIEAPTGADYSWTLALDGNLIVVGNPLASAAFVYERQGTSWQQLARLQALSYDSQGNPYKNFGRSIAVKGNLIAVTSDHGNRTTAELLLRDGTSPSWFRAQTGDYDAARTTLLKTALGDGAWVVSHWKDNSAGADTGLVEVFENVPAAWANAAQRGVDVGWDTLPGRNEGFNGGVAILGSGRDIWDREDRCRYVVQPFTGNGTFVVRAQRSGGGNDWAKSGLMIRETLAADAKEVMAFVTHGGHVGLQARTETGGMTGSSPDATGAFPVWLMLDRQGDDIHGYRSVDGNTWVSMGTTRLTLPETIYVGFAVASHTTNSWVETDFDQILFLADNDDTGEPSALVAPGDFHADPPASRNVVLHWTDNTGLETGYELERRGGENTFYALIATLPANTVQYQDTQLIPNTAYDYRLRAIRGDEHSASVDLNVHTAVESGGPGNDDIGTTGGSTAVDGGTIALTVGGVDIWGTADGFRYHYLAAEGDVTLTARVASLGFSAPWAKAGVMIRTDLSPQSQNAAMLLTAGNVSTFQTRATAGVDTEMIAGPWVHAPYWVRLTRRGQTLAGYVSPDGVAWTLVGTRDVTLGTEVYIGLAATAHATSTTTTAAFDHMTLVQEGPPPPPPTGTWLPQLWGGATGSVTEPSANAVALIATGSDIWNNSDSGMFASHDWTGDGEFVARIDSISNVHPWTKVGLMFRASNDPGAANIFAAILPQNGAILQARTTNGGASTQLQQKWGVMPGSVWLKLVRHGDTFTATYAFSNSGGTEWYPLGSLTIAMPATIKAGVALSSHDPAQSANAAVSDISLK